MNGRKALLTLCLICIFITAVPASAFADLTDVDPYQQLFNQSMGEEFGEEKPLFMQYSPIDYRLDYLHGSSTSSGGSTFLLINTILSFCMVGMALAAKLTIDIMTWAFSYNQIEVLTENIQQIVDTLMDDLFFTELFVIGLLFLGVSLIFTFMKREDVGGKLLKVIVNLVIAFTLISGMGVIIKSLNEISEWGSDAVFIAFESVSGNTLKDYNEDKGKNAFLNISEKFFEYNVHIPWQLSEFGLYVASKDTNLTAEEQQLKTKTTETLNMDVQSGNQDDQSGLAALDPSKFTSRFGDNNNNANENNQNNESISMSSFGIPFRIFVVWLTFTVGTLYGCLLLALAGTSIICQFLMFLLAIIAPIVFVLVLIPEWGDQMLIRWIQGIVAAAIYKVIASLLLIMILFLQGKIYDVTESWAYAMFAQVVLVFAVFLFRKNLLEYIPLPGVAAFQYTENTLFDKGKSFVDKTFDSVVDRAKSVNVIGNVSGMSVGNREAVSTRAMVNNANESERSNRQAFFQNLGNLVQSKSDTKSDKQEQSDKKGQSSQSSLRRRSDLGESEVTSLFGENGQTKRKGARNAVSGKENFVHVGDVKDAIDRLAETQKGKGAKLRTNANKEGIEEQFKSDKGLRNTSDPVDVRIVGMKPLPNKANGLKETEPQKTLRDTSQNKQTEEETIEVNKRTVTPKVEKDNVEEVNKSTQKIAKLPFPEVDEQDKTNQLDDLDPKQMLEQQALGPDGDDHDKSQNADKNQQQKKKGSWLGKMVDKLKG